jgi:hypothetical protein
MLHPLPFTTFGELAGLGFKATVYCSRCYEHRPIDANTEHFRDRCFATTRFKCTKVRYTGDVCGCIGSVEIQPTVLLPIGGKDDIAFLFCVLSAVVGDQPCADRPTAMVSGEAGKRRPLQVSRLPPPGGLAHPWADLAAELRPRRRSMRILAHRGAKAPGVY